MHKMKVLIGFFVMMLVACMVSAYPTRGTKTTNPSPSAIRRLRREVSETETAVLALIKASEKTGVKEAETAAKPSDPAVGTDLKPSDPTAEADLKPSDPTAEADLKPSEPAVPKDTAAPTATGPATRKRRETIEAEVSSIVVAEAEASAKTNDKPIETSDKPQEAEPTQSEASKSSEPVTPEAAPEAAAPESSTSESPALPAPETSRTETKPCKATSSATEAAKIEVVEATPNLIAA